MNTIHFNQIVKHYIERFEYLNDNEHWEYYKWQICGQFRSVMDAALSASAESFPDALYEAKKLSKNQIDSVTQPFTGLVEFAKREPETVRRMFLDLYADDGGNYQVKQQKAQDFLQKSHALRDQYFAGSWMYNDDFHSVSGYAFLYDPDHNYLFKSTQARDFADCIGFMEDWGYGAATRLDVFYRMCDEVVAQIQKTPELLETDASRFDRNVFPVADQFHPDKAKHILCFDLIYCSTVYHLFHGISFNPISLQEKKLYAEKARIAQERKNEYVQAKEREYALFDALDALQTVLAPGTQVMHKSFGVGVVKEINTVTVLIDFVKNGLKTLGIAGTIGAGLIRTENRDSDAWLNQNQSLLRDALQIPKRVKQAEQNLIPYTEYLE